MPIRSGRGSGGKIIAGSFVTKYETEARDYFVIVVPKPEIVLPLIEDALAQITAKPNQKKRKRIAEEASAIAAIRAATTPSISPSLNRRSDRRSLRWVV